MLSYDGVGRKVLYVLYKCSRILFRKGNKKLGLSVKGSPSFGFMALLLGAIHRSSRDTTVFYERCNRILCKMNGMLRDERLRLLDTCRDVESLQHVACNEQRRNDVEGDRHLVETTSEYLNEGIADETQCHTFCNVVG